MAKYENFKAKGLTADWGKSKNKGTDFVSVIFGVVDDSGQPKLDASGKQISFEWTGYFTDATTERSIQSLRTCGCTFPGDDVTNLAGLDKNVVEIQVEDTDFGKRVAWVNVPRVSSVTDETRLDKGAKLAISARMKGLVIATKGGATRPAQAAPAQSTHDPFALAPTATPPANDEGEALPATGTDNLPF